MNAIKKCKQFLLVQRGDWFKPLRYRNGDYIYDENDRGLAGKDPLSPAHKEARSARLEKEDRESIRLLMSTGAKCVNGLIALAIMAAIIAGLINVFSS